MLYDCVLWVVLCVVVAVCLYWAWGDDGPAVCIFSISAFSFSHMLLSPTHTPLIPFHPPPQINALVTDKHEKALVGNVVSPAELGVSYEMIGGLQDVKVCPVCICVFKYMFECTFVCMYVRECMYLIHV